jgi:glycosyltransferase involved in cell wall biosynthesis
MARRERVCVVTELTGGVGVYARNLVAGLVAHGAEVTVATPHPDRAPAGVARVVPAKAHRGRGRFIAQSWSFARALHDLDGEFDVVHVTDARYALFVRGAAAPVVGTMNDYFYAITGWFSPVGTRAVYEDWRARHVYYNLTRVLERSALRRLQGVLCISAEVKDVLAARYGLDPRRLVVVPYGIAYGPTDVAPRRSGRPAVVFVGGNFQRKGLGVLVDAAPEILATLPDLEVVVIGTSRDEALMMARVRERRLDGTFRFVGQVGYRELYEYYLGADVLAMPSVLEAFGIPYLEAMHCGIPVVASDSPGPTDYLRDGENALMPARGDPVALARAIVAVMTDEDLRERLVAAGRVTAEDATVDLMVARTIDAYRTIRSVGGRATSR